MTSTLTPPYPSDQHNNASSIPVRIVSGGGSSSAPYVFTPLGYQQITSLSSATNLTPPTGATVAAINVATAAVSYRDDGVAPTSTVGMPLAVNTNFIYQGSLTAIQFIQATSGAVLNVTYYK